jgi:hypothetical protein
VFVYLNLTVWSTQLPQHVMCSPLVYVEGPHNIVLVLQKGISETAFILLINNSSSR